jgi:hypothetical protein
VHALEAVRRELRLERRHATYAPLHGGHFIFLSQHAAIATATDRWLRGSASVSLLR